MITEGISLVPTELSLPAAAQGTTLAISVGQPADAI